MKVLLRHTKTGHYYMGHYNWSTGPADAKSLKSIEEALGVIIRENLNGMSLVVFHNASDEGQVFDLASEDRIPETN